MSNRVKSLDANVTHLKVDPLQSLFDSCRRNGRSAKFPTKEEPLYSDTEMFRWWLQEGQFTEKYLEEFTEGAKSYWSMQQYRDWFRKVMKEYYHV